MPVRAVRARVVQIKYPNSIQATWALQFSSGGQKYFLIKNPFRGRQMFGPTDAVTVLSETERIVLLPYKVAMTIVLDEQLRTALSKEVATFVTKRRDWFRNPTLKSA